MKKSELRKIYHQKRAELSPSEKKKLEENIFQQIIDFEVNHIKNVHLFLSLKKFNEIDTQPIIDYFRNQNKQIIISKCNFEDNSLSHFIFDENTELVKNKFGVLEPVNAKQILEKEIDLIFVPLLISDEKNYRVGYGKGFYDKFLAKCRKDAKKIGLNFFKPVEEIEDINSFDISLNNVIYPKN